MNKTFTLPYCTYYVKWKKTLNQGSLNKDFVLSYKKTRSPKLDREVSGEGNYKHIAVTTSELPKT